MQNFITVSKAKERAHRLQTYIYLVETYQAKSMEEHIIQQYAYLGSLSKVADKMREMGYEVEIDDVRNAIQSRSKNELHKIIRKGYMKRSRYSKR